MSNIRQRKQLNNRGSNLRCAALLFLLGIFVAVPTTHATEANAETNNVSKELLTVEQESASSTASGNSDSRDDLEPSTLALLALGLIALGLVRRKVRE